MTTAVALGFQETATARGVDLEPGQRQNTVTPHLHNSSTVRTAHSMLMLGREERGRGGGLLPLRLGVRTRHYPCSRVHVQHLWLAQDGADGDQELAYGGGDETNGTPEEASVEPLHAPNKPRRHRTRLPADGRGGVEGQEELDRGCGLGGGCAVHASTSSRRCQKSPHPRPRWPAAPGCIGWSLRSRTCPSRSPAAPSPAPRLAQSTGPEAARGEEVRQTWQKAAAAKLRGTIDETAQARNRLHPSQDEMQMDQQERKGGELTLVPDIAIVSMISCEILKSGSGLHPRKAEPAVGCRQKR
eukprot:748373-Hanusia_phi.AAC.5